MSTNFFDQLNQSIDFSAIANDPYARSYDEIKQIAESIEKKLNEGLQERPIRVEIEPGFRATMGQQLRVNIRIPAKEFRDTLFRAYVPVDGRPIFLDLYGEEPEKCDDFSELQRRILEFLIQIKDRMASYRDYATQ